jgi:hypothetical protein
VPLARVLGNRAVGRALADSVQRKMGFELELKVLVDIDGRPPPEKVPLGTVGPHLDVTVDQNGEVDSPTPTGAAAAVATNIPRSGGGVRTVGQYDLPAGWGRRVVYQTAAGAQTVYPNEAVLDASHPPPHPVGDQVLVRYRRASDNTLHARHPLGPGMGTDRYASIIELVTKAYDEETPAGARDLRAAMDAAVTFAGDIRDDVNARRRIALNTVNNVAVNEPTTHIGNTNQPNRQSVFASIQTTLGINIAQYAQLLTSLLTQGNQDFFLLKHSTEFAGEEGEVLQRELLAAVADADAVIAHFGTRLRRTILRDKTLDLKHMRGLLTLMSQYLRLGKLSYDPQSARWALDKNTVAIMARSDLAAVYRALPSDDRSWLGQQTAAAVSARLLAEAHRTAGTRLFTDPAEARTDAPYDPALRAITVDAFVDNVFTQGSDGVTPHFGAIRMMGPERVRQARWDGASRRKEKSGPVFEIRNMMPGLGARSRFPPAEWRPLADYLIELSAELNNRRGRVQTPLTPADLGLVGPAAPVVPRDQQSAALPGMAFGRVL